MPRTTPSPARSSAGTSTTATARSGRGSTGSSAMPRSTTCAADASDASPSRRWPRSPSGLGRGRLGRRRRPVRPRSSTRDLIETGLAGPQARCRAALVLRHYYGYDYAEIAGFLRTSPGNVGSILSRAHATLRDPTGRGPGRADDRAMPRTEPSDDPRCPDGSRPPEPVTARDPLDDAALAALVRDVADDWHMPPQRLDEVTWRDRVGSRTSRRRWRRSWCPLDAAPLRGGGDRGRRDRLALVRGRLADRAAGDHGRRSAPPAARSPARVAARAPAPGPEPVAERGRCCRSSSLNGDLPTPRRSWSGRRTVRRRRPRDGHARPEGHRRHTGPEHRSWRAPAAAGSASAATGPQLATGGPNGLRAHARCRRCGRGRRPSARSSRSSPGTYDPNASQGGCSRSSSMRERDGTPDGRYALIGWSRRDGAAGWEIGVDVLDLATLEVTEHEAVTLDEPVAVDGSPRDADRPGRVGLARRAATILLSSFWYVEEPNDPTPSVRHGPLGRRCSRTASSARARPQRRVSRRPARPRCADCSEFDARPDRQGQLLHALLDAGCGRLDGHAGRRRRLRHRHDGAAARRERGGVDADHADRRRALLWNPFGPHDRSASTSTTGERHRRRGPTAADRRRHSCDRPRVARPPRSGT